MEGEGKNGEKRAHVEFNGRRGKEWREACTCRVQWKVGGGGGNEEV